MKTFFIMAMAAMTLSANAENNNVPDYKNPKLSIEVRINDLMSRMTLEEKVGQMNQYVGLEHIRENSKSMTSADLKTNTATAFYPGITDKDVARYTEQGLIGSFLHVLTLEEANELQRLNMKSRLQIPLLIGIDAIHGNAKCKNNTVYPTNIGLASSFDVAMAYVIARQTAQEMRAMNMHWTFNPNVEVQRDGRWGRSGETFGEDPYLVTQMGVATTKGYQGNLDSNEDVLACFKHFVGGSMSINGTNGAPAEISERTLREVFFPPFRACMEAGGATLMTSHNELNGIPCHTNKWLMTDVLRNEWGFKGFIISDWMDIEHCADLHHTARDNKDAFYQSIMAGMDMHMHGTEWQEDVVQLVREGKIPESRIDESVRKILYYKFKLGLFENPIVDVKTRDKVINDPVHKQTALEATRNSIVLLKNDGLLPLDASKYKKVLVTGINADDQNIMGDWSEPQPEDKVSTVLKGLRTVQPGVDFKFVDQGWDPRNMDPKKIDEAVEAAKDCDLNIVCCGEYMMRFRWYDRTSGEDTDRDNLDLVGLQEQLIEKLFATGKPTVLVIISGRPLSIVWPAEHLPAIVNAWEPGQFGGQAIAEILYGKVNPSAKLAMTMPRSAGQIQTVYNHKPSAFFHPVVCGTSEPLYPFGYGLSYTTYQYSDLHLSSSKISQGDSLVATVTITNKGNRDGVEIAQLYIHDEVSSVTRPVKMLKDFKRVALKAGESKQVSFNITPDKLAFYDLNMNYTVEPGDFSVLVGGSSRDADLQKATFSVNDDKGTSDGVDNSKKMMSSYVASLKSMASRGYMFGHQDDPMYGTRWHFDEGRSDTKAVCGDYPALMGFDLGMIELASPNNLDGVPFDRIRTEVQKQYARGGYVTLSWHPHNPATSNNAWDVTGGNVVSTILPGGKNYVKFQLYLERVAKFINSLKTSDGKAIPVIFRPWHENTGSWFWWGQKFCSADEYRALWQLTENYLFVHGVKNVIYAYSPGTEPRDTASYLERYPGDKLVDLVGFDCYQWNPEGATDYVATMNRMLNIITEVGRTHNKITAVTETGYRNTPQADWWTGTLQSILDKYPVSYVLVWRNAWDKPEENFGPAPDKNSVSDFKKFYKSPRTLFVKDMKNK
jgi:beta-glucosidase